MDKIIFMNINIIDHDEMIIIQSMIHITGQDFSSIFKDSSTNWTQRLQIYYNSVR